MRSTGIAFVLALTSVPLLAGLPMGPPGADSNTNVPPNKSGPRDFAGIWWPDAGGPGGPGGAPGAGGPGGPGGPPGGGPPGGGPPGGGLPSGPPPGGDDPDRLQCAPIFRLSGGGGGSTVLIVQDAKLLVMSGEELSGTFQRIHIGGSHPPAGQLVPQPNGHVIGKWEGDTLVVDGIGYADNKGKDIGQHVVERIRKQGNTLIVEAITTGKDGKSRTQNMQWAWRPDLQYNESICEETFDRYQITEDGVYIPNVPERPE